MLLSKNFKFCLQFKFILVFFFLCKPASIYLACMSLYHNLLFNIVCRNLNYLFASTAWLAWHYITFHIQQHEENAAHIFIAR